MRDCHKIRAAFIAPVKFEEKHQMEDTKLVSSEGQLSFLTNTQNLDFAQDETQLCVLLKDLAFLLVYLPMCQIFSYTQRLF